MKTGPRIRQVKREIRTLGVVAKRYKTGSLAVGVIFRGGLYLDGVIKATANSPDITNTIVEMIKSSPHYPQIRVIIIHEGLIEEVKVDPSKLYGEVMRPLLLLSDEEFSVKEYKASRGTLEVKLGDKTVNVMPFGLGRREAEKILMITTRNGALPEPIRVAELISSALLAMEKQKV